MNDKSWLDKYEILKKISLVPPNVIIMVLMEKGPEIESKFSQIFTFALDDLDRIIY